MNATQRKYTLSRLEDIFQKSRTLISKEHWVTCLSSEEMLDLIYSGSVTLIPKEANSSQQRYSIFSLYDFSSFERKTGMSPEGQELLEKLEKDYTKACDDAMLGDCTEALELLEKYSNYNPTQQPKEKV